MTAVTMAVARRLALLVLISISAALAVVWLVRTPPTYRLTDHLQPATSQTEDGTFASFVSDGSLSGPVTLDGETRLSLTPPLPAGLDFDLTLPAQPSLQFAVGIESEREVSRAKVELEVTVESEGEETVVYRETFRSFQLNRWYPRRVDLNPWSEKPARIRLEVRPAFGISNPPWADRIRVAWGEPVVTRRERGGGPGAEIDSASVRRSDDADERPSILFVLVDTLRADYLGSYGFQGDVSPGLDRLAAESVRFQNCFSQAPWTKPSIATLFTSLYPDVHGLTNHEGLFWGPERAEMKTGVLPEEALTLAELLQQGGYRTAAFMTNPTLAPIYGFHQGFETYQFHEVGDLSRLVMDAAVGWIDSLPRRQPFFAYLHFMDVHGPYDGSQEDFEAVRDSPSLGSSRRLTHQEVEAISDYLKRIPWARSSEAQEVVNWRARYAAGVRDFDRRFASFIEELRTAGRLDEMYLVITSDHGEELFDHQGWDHGHTLFAEQLHVPLLIRRPHGEEAGTVKNIVSLIDLMPTLLSVAGIGPASGLQGRDLSHLLDVDPSADTGASLGAATSDRPGLHALRTRDYKLILDIDSGETWLFDARADPEEQENLATRQPEIARELRERLLVHLAESTSHGALEKSQVPLSEDLVEQLRSLGYLQ